MTDELEKQRRETAIEPLGSRHKFERFLSFHLEQVEEGWLEDLPAWMRVPFKAMLASMMKRRDEVLDKLDDDSLDSFFAQYADVLLQLRSDTAAVSMRVVGFADPESESLFTYFLEHRDEIEASVGKPAPVINGEPPQKLPEGDGPGEIPSDLGDDATVTATQEIYATTDEDDDVGDFNQ